MFGLTDIDIVFLSGLPWIVALALLGLLALAVWIYFRTNPPLPRFKRLLLGALRMIAVLAVMGALLEPVIHFTREYERKRQVAVLVDHSASMDREELGKSRAARLDSLFSQAAYERIQNQAEVDRHFFADLLASERNDVGRDKTALGEAIHELSRRELARPNDAWLVFTDGNSNTGRQPVEAARGLSVPIYAVDLAHGVGRFDVALGGIDFNPVVFVGRRSEIKINLSWHSASGQTLIIQLFDRDRLLDETRYNLSQEDGLGEIALNYVPDEPGQKLLRIHVPEVEGEESSGNNEKTIAVKVLKSRMNVLLVTARPDYEVGFLNRYLRQSEKYDVTMVATGSASGNVGGRFPSTQTELNRYDAVILHDPVPSELTPYRGILTSYLSEKGGAVWVLMAERFTSLRPTDWFRDLLPFYPLNEGALSLADFQGEPIEGHLFHPAVRLADDRTSIRETWSTLPPFRTLVRCSQTDPNGVVLVTTTGPGFLGRGFPVLGYKRFGPGKLMAMSALPIWPWGFVQLGFGEDDRNYQRFIEGVLSWLTVPEDFDPIRIRPEKEVYSRGESIRFEGFAYDQGFRPIPGVTGSVTLESEQAPDRYQADLIQRGEGQFAAELTRVPPGRYQYLASFEKGGQLLKSMEGEVLVETFSLEEFDQGGDPATLRAIARLSGGDYATYRQFDEMMSTFDLSKVTEHVTGEITIWGRLWLLLIFIGALGLEWLLRKTNHLI
jgi:hypothetical protein